LASESQTGFSQSTRTEEYVDQNMNSFGRLPLLEAVKCTKIDGNSSKPTAERVRYRDIVVVFVFGVTATSYDSDLSKATSGIYCSATIRVLI
jgi:hypothetical protein